LAAKAIRRHYSAGYPIFFASDRGESLLGIVKGTIRITRSTQKGDEIILGDLSAGDFFGEIALLDGRGRSADARALTTCEVVVLERRDFIHFLQQHPECYDHLLEVLCTRIRLSDERSSDFLFLDLASRLAKTLLKLSESDPSRSPQGKISHTQGELARIVGGTRPNVNRLLKKWERAGVVEQRKGWIIVKQRSMLAAMAALREGESD
jgi:CRP-like cAMP-binding protein